MDGSVGGILATLGTGLFFCLLVIVLKKGVTASKDDILAFMQGKVAKWWMPDDVVFVDEIPHTATGKIQKITLRQQFKDYRLPGAPAAG
jgi:fatty-acyl-CoA synthase